MNQSSFIDLWTRQYPGQIVPPATLDDPIYVLFNILVPFRCPNMRIDDVVLDRPDRLLYGEFTALDQDQGCGDTGGAHTFVVAIRRGALPQGPLTMRLERDFTVCSECGREREQVEVEL